MNTCSRTRKQARGSELWFSVADDGPGISKDDLAHVFERYWRSDDATYKGTGLGLAIADGILAAHKGRIWAQSDPGHGATFWFALPGMDANPSPSAPSAPDMTEAAEK